MQQAIKEFHDEIETYLSDNGVTIIEAISYYCDVRGIDYSDIVEIISETHMESIREYALANKLIKPTPTLF